jgi:O-antigen ligase
LQAQSAILPILDVWMARILTICIFLPERWQVYAAVGCSIFFFLRSLMLWQAPEWSDLGKAFLLGSIYILYLTAPIFSPASAINEITVHIEHKISLILLPLTFAVIDTRHRSLIIEQLPLFAYGAILTATYGSLYFIYVASHEAYSAHNAHVFYRQVIEGSTGIHPTYLSMYLVLSVSILLTQNSTVTTRKWTNKACILLSILHLTCLFAKTPYLALLLIFAIYCWTYRQNLYRYKWSILAIFVAGISISLSIPIFRQRLQELSTLFDKENNNLVANSINMRKLIWNTDLKMMQHYWINGTGPGQTMQKLQYRYMFFATSQQNNVGTYDPHNQYMYEWLSFGIIGITLILAVFAYQFAHALKHKKTIYFYFLITLCLTCGTESLLQRQQGVIFYALFSSIFFFSNNYTSKKSIA